MQEGQTQLLLPVGIRVVEQSPFPAKKRNSPLHFSILRAKESFRVVVAVVTPQQVDMQLVALMEAEDDDDNYDGRDDDAGSPTLRGEPALCPPPLWTLTDRDGNAVPRQTDKFTSFNCAATSTTGYETLFTFEFRMLAMNGEFRMRFSVVDPTTGFEQCSALSHRFVVVSNTGGERIKTQVRDLLCYQFLDQNVRTVLAGLNLISTALFVWRGKKLIRSRADADWVRSNIATIGPLESAMDEATFARSFDTMLGLLGLSFWSSRLLKDMWHFDTPALYVSHDLSIACK